MFTSLDLLVIAFMVLGAITLLSLCLMFLIRNSKARKVFFYIVSGLGVYMAWVGFRIGYGGMFPIQMVIGILVAIMCISAFIIERRFKDNERLFLVARIISSVALITGLINAVF